MGETSHGTAHQPSCLECLLILHIYVHHLRNHLKTNKWRHIKIFSRKCFALRLFRNSMMTKLIWGRPRIQNRLLKGLLSPKTNHRSISLRPRGWSHLSQATPHLCNQVCVAAHNSSLSNMKHKTSIKSIKIRKVASSKP